MKRIERVSLLALALLAAGGMLFEASAQPVNIAVVDMDKVFNEYHRTRTLNERLQQSAQEFRAEHEQLMQDLEAMQEQFQGLREEALNVALSDEVRERKRNEAEDLTTTIAEKEGQVREQLERRGRELEAQQRRMRDRVLEEIRERVTSHARSQGFALVLNSSGRGQGGVEQVVFHESRIDITRRILELLNQEATP